MVLSWPLTQASTVWRRAGRAVDIDVELAIDRGPYSVEAAGRAVDIDVELAVDSRQCSVEAGREGGGY